MEDRTENSAGKMVERLDALERDVAVFKSNYATRADVPDARSSIVMRVMSAILLAQVLPTLLKKFGM